MYGKSLIQTHFTEKKTNSQPNHVYLQKACFMFQKYENYFIQTYLVETFEDTTAVISEYG